MNARDVMTRDVVLVRPDTPAPEIARLLIERGISAVPVVDDAGAPVGMVSEGDLIGRDESEREARRDWWLQLLAEGTELHPDFVASLRTPVRTARGLMAVPVVTVAEDTEVPEIARLLAAYRVKRVPVVRDGRIVGIVSRADLVRALTREAPAPAAPPKGGLFGEALAVLDREFGRRERPDRPAAPAWQRDAHEAEPLAPEPLAEDFRGLVSDFEHKEAEQRAEARRLAAAERRRRVETLIDHHVSDESWRTLVHQARQAAEHGETEFLLLRFPAQLCSDGARAINVSEPDWPATLRGEAAEVYLRWAHELRPHGFHLAARVLDFPGGKPGDVGLFLVWGK